MRAIVHALTRTLHCAWITFPFYALTLVCPSLRTPIVVNVFTCARPWLCMPLLTYTPAPPPLVYVLSCIYPLLVYTLLETNFNSCTLCLCMLPMAHVLPNASLYMCMPFPIYSLPVRALTHVRPYSRTRLVLYAVTHLCTPIRVHARHCARSNACMSSLVHDFACVHSYLSHPLTCACHYVWPPLLLTRVCP